MEMIIKNNQKKTKRNLIFCSLFLIIALVMLYMGLSGQDMPGQWVAVVLPMVCILLFGIGIFANFYFITHDGGIIIIGDHSVKVRLAEAEEMIDVPYAEIKGIRLFDVAEGGVEGDKKVIREHEKYLAINVFDEDQLLARVSQSAQSVIRANLRMKKFPIMVLANDNLTIPIEEVFEELLKQVSSPPPSETTTDSSNSNA